MGHVDENLDFAALTRDKDILEQQIRTIDDEIADLKWRQQRIANRLREVASRRSVLCTNHDWRFGLCSVCGRRAPLADTFNHTHQVPLMGKIDKSVLADQLKKGFFNGPLLITTDHCA